jgi:pilus assembly protein CpaF
MSYVDFPALRPIRELLIDPSISEIMINGTGRLFVERDGVMEPLRAVFQTQAQLDAAIESLIGLTGRAVNTLTPFVDFRLPDGSRVNIAVRPVALDGPIITIRRASRGLARLEDLVARHALTARMADLLRGCVAARLNILFSGGTGSGKTTLLGLLGQYIPQNERIVIIEDTAELVFTQPNVVRLECRPPNLEGSGAVKLADLLKNSLRMRPTRIILGEVRGEEAFDLLAAMSSGHDGGFAVLHASSPTDAIARLGMMVLARGLPFPMWAIQQQIAQAVHVVVQHAQLADGSRRVMNITAVQGVHNGEVALKDVFTFDPQEGVFRVGTSEPVWLAHVRRVAPLLVEGLFDGPDGSMREPASTDHNIMTEHFDPREAPPASKRRHT